MQDNDYSCAASDHVTRILKEYGDVLDRYQLSPEKADIGAELRVLRGLLLLIKLTGLLTFRPSQSIALTSLNAVAFLTLNACAALCQAA